MMPSGGLRPIQWEEAEKVAKTAKAAFDNGLQAEWFAYFIGGIQDGVRPIEAAYLAAVEWDF